MNNITDISKLIYFKTENYNYMNENTFDASNCPRPHFCVGLLKKGSATFIDSESGDTINIKEGDIIFVPFSSRYVSKWTGTPEINYISMHFLFEYPSSFSIHNNYKLQKIQIKDDPFLFDYFQYILENQNKESIHQLAVLSKIYALLEKFSPLLTTKSKKQIDSRLTKAIDFIKNNYKTKISIEQLSSACYMSPSRFFSNFKKCFGLTPIQYINNYRINRAILLLVQNELNIEEISDAVGFESSIYFRRVFKQATSKTPLEYRNSSTEI